MNSEDTVITLDDTKPTHVSKLSTDRLSPQQDLAQGADPPPSEFPTNSMSLLDGTTEASVDCVSELLDPSCNVECILPPDSGPYDHSVPAREETWPEQLVSREERSPRIKTEPSSTREDSLPGKYPRFPVLDVQRDRAGNRVPASRSPVGTNIFCCEYCRYQCPGEELLDAHVKCMHRDELPQRKRLLCSPYELLKPAKSRRYVLAPSEEEPVREFQCELCLKSYEERENLEKHVRATHSDLEPYACPECGATFAHNAFLNLHLRKAHGLKLAASQSHSD